jgi:hypothetical protein
MKNQNVVPLNNTIDINEIEQSFTSRDLSFKPIIVLPYSSVSITENASQEGPPLYAKTP